ncbi:MAG: C10 family peptidase [Candidatus Cloacimonetes bacterium]|nr:C10 family peptidase [Candidatus Cloacimonadota bacterium]
MKKLIVFILFILSFLMVFANTVSPERATNIGNDIFAFLSGSNTRLSGLETYRGSESPQVDFYILRFEPQGFMILAAEEQSAPILAYSLESNFPNDKLPSHIEWYLSQYSKAMAEIRNHPEWAVDPAWNILERKDFAAYSFNRDVTPLCSTTWDQDWPYNSMCPADVSGPGGRVYAGCVATAMGQVMKKWNYPTTGNGSHSYNATGYGTQTANFGATTYNWSSMPNSTSSVNTSISTLLYHCGVSVDMTYAPDGSGAFSDAGRNALVNYFRYNSAAQYKTASSYSATSWATMLRGDLDLGRPIYYGGQGADGGHAFVLDGYQGTDYFHFNWGWSGYYNGYYYLNNLNPGSSTFNQYQAAILYVYPLSTETANPPTNVVATESGSSVNVTWQAPGGAQTGFSDGFETYTDFALSFAPWTLVDVDLSTTYGITNISWPNAYAAQAYMIFNPSATSPETTGLSAHNGMKMAACFAASTPPNNDWMISPQIIVAAGDVASFWACSYVVDYGLERFKVGISTTGTAPANFTIISGASYISAPVEWTQYSYNLSAYVGQQVRVGIQCISNDAFIFLVDDVHVGSPSVSGNLATMPNTQKDLAKVNVQAQNIGKLAVKARKQYNPATGIVSREPSIDLSLLVMSDPSRALTGYKVWRFTVGQESNEASWISLTPNAISATTYLDTGWGALASGTYKWAVKAVYTGGLLSPAALSNPLAKITQAGTIAGVVRNQTNQPILGATITAGTYSATTNASGAYSMVAPAGTHSVTAAHTSYESSTQTGVIIVSNQTTTLNFVLAPSQNMLVDGFETYTNFALSFAPWTLVDVDLSTTYGVTEIAFQNSGAAMAYIIFNPSATTPAIASMTTHGGVKMAASFASTLPPNNDWLITPQISGASQIKFWAKSYTEQYGLERFKVGVSTTGTAPASFTIISGASYISAPVDWTEYTYDLSSYGTTPIRVGIQCVSNDAFIFFVDDVSVIGGSTPQDPFGTPTVLPTSMSVVAGVTIGGVQASNGDVLAAYVNVGGTPQLRGKQTIQVIDGVAGCLIQVYTESNGETISFKVWDASANQVISSATTLASIVNGTVGGVGNLFMINAANSLTQTIAMLSGWNLVSLNVSPSNHTISSLISAISANVQQIKGTEGVYIPNNPYSTLTSLSDGKAYNILMSTAASWSVTGSAIIATTPIAMLDGWNMVAYLPQTSLPVATAVQSISSWLVQVKGTDGVYIPNNPYSTLSTMYPNKGYWININGAHNLIYPSGSKDAVSVRENRAELSVCILSSSMTVLSKCKDASTGDILLARVNGELRGAEKFIAPEGFAAALIHIYTETSGEEIEFSILKVDGSELPISTTISSQPQEMIGSYPSFYNLELKAGDTPVPVPTLLLGCYPNPFNPSTTISFSIAQDNSPVSIEIYNLKGQKVTTLVNTQLSKGNHSIVWTGKDDRKHSVASGVYIIRMSADGYNKSMKALLSK